MRAVILFVGICVLASASGQKHDLIVGDVTNKDLVLYKSHEVKYGFPFFYRYSIVQFPLPGHLEVSWIHGISVKDNCRDGTGGYPSIYSGGVGKTHVQILLESQRSHGFNFTVTIFGTPYKVGKS